MSNIGKLPITESAVAGYKFLFQNIAILLPALALFVILQVLVMKMIGNTYIEALELMRGGDFENANLKSISSNGLLLILMLVSIYFYSTVNKIAVLDQPGGLFGLSLHISDLWYVLQYLLLILVLMLVIFGMVIIGSIVIAITALIAKPLAAFVAILFIIGVLLGLYVVLARFSLAFPMATDRNKFSLFDGWALGAGNSWRIFLAFLLAYLPIIVLMTIVYSVFFGADLATFSQQMQSAVEALQNDPQNINEFNLVMYEFNASIYSDIAKLSVLALLNVVATAILSGTGAYMYLGLRDQKVEANDV